MILVVLLVFFDLFVKLFNILVIGRILMSWTRLDPETNVFARILFETTEPILAQVRKLIRSSGSFDLAPLVTVLLLWGLHVLVFGA